MACSGKGLRLREGNQMAFWFGYAAQIGKIGPIDSHAHSAAGTDPAPRAVLAIGPKPFQHRSVNT
jgi:hypothetical protein